MRGRLLLAVGAAIVVVLASPFVGQINGWVQRILPGQHVSVLLAAVLLPGAAAVVAALVRIRERRVLRYGLLAAAAAVAFTYATVMETTRTEQFHFTEYGLLAILFYRAWHRRGDASVVVLAACAAVVAGFADEWFQWFVPSRVGEARDVVLNSVGVACGLLIAVAISPVAVAARLQARARRAIAAGVACVVVTGAAFLHTVHLGYDIADGEGRTFRSRYGADTLRAMARDRRERWRRQGWPGARPLISREDHYQSEALFHVSWRNQAASGNDAWSAWNENRILETFYAPVLELAPPGVRWPPEQREQMRAAAVAARPYASAAYPFPIYAWNRWWFWGATLSLVAALWLISR